MRRRRSTWGIYVLSLLGLGQLAWGGDWTPIPVDTDPLVRMPGTQPGAVTIEAPNSCLTCHGEFDTATEPYHQWRGSMMAQSARDPFFWAALTVAAQDSIHLLGNPNATDLCLRCHMPKGWLEGRSDDGTGTGTNGSLLQGADFDGVQCGFCHSLTDPHFDALYDGERECLAPGCDWTEYWDEAGPLSQAEADTTWGEDVAMVTSHEVSFFDGGNFFDDDDLSPGYLRPVSAGYTENAAGQYFVSPDVMSGPALRRGPFADLDPFHSHEFRYSRYHKSRNFCATCHDVSNPVFVNTGAPGGSPLPTETMPAHAYGHVERTFSEMVLSDFGLDGGAPGEGPFAPELFSTSMPDNRIARCQDCHMRDEPGFACNPGFTNAVERPSGSLEHPESGVPSHDLMGANLLVPWVLASIDPFSPNYDATNEALLRQGPGALTLDFTQGLALDPQALLDAVDRARRNLEDAAAIRQVAYDAATGALGFRVQNYTGHKLITGYPEGRRMWVNVRVYDRVGAQLVLLEEVNPYDETEDTLRGLPNRPLGPTVGPNQSYVDALVYEIHRSASTTGEAHSQHFVLADGRTKDNRIPPRGFRIAEAAARESEPYWQGLAAPDYFTAAEYAGGWDDVVLTVPAGAERIEIRLYYQTVSREYAEFLSEEILGTATTLPPAAYIAQTDTFFDALAAWGSTIWNLWDHNREVPGAAPVLMTEVAFDPIFADGFESGDTLAWFSATP